MAELEWRGPIEPASLRRALRLALRRLAPGWRVIAEGFLGQSTPIDLLAIGEAGELICIRAQPPIEGGQRDEGGARLLAQGLSDLGWIAPRVADLRKLAPELGMSELAQPRCQLLAPTFDAEVVAAADQVGSVLGEGRLALTRYRPARQQGQLALLLEPRKSGPSPWAPGATSSAAVADLDASPLTDPPSPSAFRTGLREVDLRTEPPLSHGWDAPGAPVAS